MRRILIALPAAALAIALLLLLRRTDPASTSAPPRTSRPAEGTQPPDPAVPSRPVPRDTGALQLRIIDAQGSPVPRARITMTNEETLDRREFEADEGGRRSLLQIPAGHYALTVRFPGRVTAELHADVQPGKVSDVTVRLLAGGRVFGMVMGDSGPLPGAKVRLLNGETKAALHSDLTAVTDDRGRYQIPGVPPQVVTMSFAHPRHRLLVKEGLSIRTAEDQVEVNVRLEAGARLAGRVLDDAGAPIARATVVAVNEDMTAGESGADGRFELFGLGAQEIVLSARAPGFGERYVRRIRPGTLDLEIRLARGGAIEGRLLADPLPKAVSFQVARFEADVGRELPSALRVVVEGDGTFRTADVAPGLVRLEVEAPGYETLDRPEVEVRPERATGNVIIRMRKKN